MYPGSGPSAGGGGVRNAARDREPGRLARRHPVRLCVPGQPEQRIVCRELKVHPASVAARVHPFQSVEWGLGVEWCRPGAHVGIDADAPLPGAMDREGRERQRYGTRGDPPARCHRGCSRAIVVDGEPSVVRCAPPSARPFPPACSRLQSSGVLLAHIPDPRSDDLPCDRSARRESHDGHTPGDRNRPDGTTAAMRPAIGRRPGRSAHAAPVMRGRTMRRRPWRLRVARADAPPGERRGSRHRARDRGALRDFPEPPDRGRAWTRPRRLHRDGARKGRGLAARPGGGGDFGGRGGAAYRGGVLAVKVLRVRDERSHRDEKSPRPISCSPWLETASSFGRPRSVARCRRCSESARMSVRGGGVDLVQGIGHHGFSSHVVGGRRRRPGPVGLDSHP